MNDRQKFLQYRINEIDYEISNMLDVSVNFKSFYDVLVPYFKIKIGREALISYRFSKNNIYSEYTAYCMR